MHAVGVLVVLGGLFVGGWSSASETVSLAPTADVYVSSSKPTQNFASSFVLYAGTASSAVYRSYLKFELTGVPKGAQVKQATLTVWSRRVNTVPTSLAAYGAGDEWDVKQLTWATAPPPQGSPLAVCSLATQVAAHQWEVTPWVASEASGDGVVTVVLAECSPPIGSWVWLADSSDGTVPGPQLTVEYEAAVPPDTTPPTVVLEVLREELWPPNHEMVLAAQVSVTDDRDPSPHVEIEVTSTEEEQTKGSGQTEPDMEWQEVKPGVWQVWLRAERSGSGDGRQYTIAVLATDQAGNAARAQAVVSVPHDRGQGKSKGR